jgi:hypothetical protein
MISQMVRVERLHGDHAIVQAWSDDGKPADWLQVAFTKPTGFGLATLVVFTDKTEWAYQAGAKVETVTVR